MSVSTQIDPPPGMSPGADLGVLFSKEREYITDEEVENAKENNEVGRIFDKGGQHSAGIRLLLYMTLLNLDVALRNIRIHPIQLLRKGIAFLTLQAKK